MLRFQLATQGLTIAIYCQYVTHQVESGMSCYALLCLVTEPVVSQTRAPDVQHSVVVDHFRIQCIVDHMLRDSKKPGSSCMVHVLLA